MNNRYPIKSSRIFDTKMQKLFLIALVALFCTVISVPVNCETNQIQGLEYDIFEEDEDLDVDSLGYVSERCKNGDACVFYCSEYKRGCPAKVYFMDFMNRVSASSAKQQLADGYMRACVYRVYDGRYSQFYIKTKIIGLLDKARRRCGGRDLSYLNIYQEFGYILNTMVNSGDAIYVFLARMAELLLTMEKMCLQNP